jgi:hypothetical protein
MEDTGNIFEGIVVNERSYTELFRNMCRYKFFRDEFARFLKQQSKDNEEWGPLSLSDFYFHPSEVETQYFAEDCGTYPDLVINTATGRLMIEIETTTWTVWHNDIVIDRRLLDEAVQLPDSLAERPIGLVIPHRLQTLPNLVSRHATQTTSSGPSNCDDVIHEELTGPIEAVRIRPDYECFGHSHTSWLSETCPEDHGPDTGNTEAVCVPMDS